MTGKPFALIDVNGNDNLVRLKQVVRENQFSWRSLNNQRTSEQPSITKEWNVRDWPTFYVIDSEGTIRHKWVGASPAKLLDKKIEELVAEAGRRASR
jgi:hypothetical protein